MTHAGYYCCQIAAQTTLRERLSVWYFILIMIPLVSPRCRDCEWPNFPPHLGYILPWQWPYHKIVTLGSGPI